jgi:hypothetical protein
MSSSTTLAVSKVATSPWSHSSATSMYLRRSIAMCGRSWVGTTACFLLKQSKDMALRVALRRHWLDSGSRRGPCGNEETSLRGGRKSCVSFGRCQFGIRDPCSQWRTQSHGEFYKSDYWMQLQGVWYQRTVIATSHGTLSGLFSVLKGGHRLEVRLPPLGDLDMCSSEVKLRVHRAWSEQY